MYIPSNIRQPAYKYALGNYIIHPRHTNNASLLNWIKELQFEQYEQPKHRLQKHTRKRNTLYSFNLPAVNKEVILKVSQISTHYNWRRTLNLFISGLLKDYSLNAYYGAIGFERIGVSSTRVLAHWTCKRQQHRTKSYLLYEKVQASMSVYELCEDITAVNQNANSIIPKIAEKLAGIVRNIHANNMRHGDPHAGNFLVNLPGKELANLQDESVEEMEFTLIDLDKIQFVRNQPNWLKKIFDLRCLRRFRVYNLEGVEGLAYYLGKPPSLLQKLILAFWMRGGFNVYKWIKPSKKRN